MKRFVCYIFAVMLPFFAMPAQARLVEVFKYQDYFDKADFIVIARPISRTADVNQKSILDEIQGTYIGRSVGRRNKIRSDKNHQR